MEENYIKKMSDEKFLETKVGHFEKHTTSAI